MAAPTRTEQELEFHRAEVVRLEAQAAAEQAAKADATHRMRELAVELHGHLCTDSHAALACTWYTDPQADSPEAADWTGAEPRHTWWLEVARTGVGLQLKLGWVVSEPPAPALR